MAGELEEFKKSLDGVLTEFGTLKGLNEKALTEVKNAGKENTETKAALEKCNKSLGELLGKQEAAAKAIEDSAEQKKRIDALEVVLKRNGGAAKGESTVAPEVKGAWDLYIRRCNTKGIDALVENKALSVGIDPDGGYFVNPDMSGRIVTRIRETSPMRQWASVITINTDALEGIVDVDEAAAGWVGETAARPATTSPQVGKWRIPTHEMYAKPLISQKLLEDSSVDVEGWVAGKVADKFSRLENTAFFTGDAVGKPRGILNYTDGSAWGFIQRTIIATTITADGVITLVYTLKDNFRRNARMLLTRTSHGLVRLLKDSQNRYLWQPAFEAGQPATVLGFPVHECADMQEAAVGAGAQLIAFGDFKEGYQIVDRTGISLLRDPYGSKPNVEFYSRKRVGGDVINTEAIKIYQRS